VIDRLSPYEYFQERYRHDPWALICVVIMLNQTNGKQLESVHRKFFELCPTPQACADVDICSLARVIGPLGLQNRRANTLKKMSRAYLSAETHEQRKKLPGVGKYARDSYELFIERRVPAEPVQDKELKRYLEWYGSLNDVEA
jgi:adenine-specific DNA glycosylase